MDAHIAMRKALKVIIDDVDEAYSNRKRSALSYRRVRRAAKTILGNDLDGVNDVMAQLEYHDEHGNPYPWANDETTQKMIAQDRINCWQKRATMDHFKAMRKFARVRDTQGAKKYIDDLYDYCDKFDAINYAQAAGFRVMFKTPDKVSPVTVSMSICDPMTAE